MTRRSLSRSPIRPHLRPLTAMVSLLVLAAALASCARPATVSEKPEDRPRSPLATTATAAPKPRAVEPTGSQELTPAITVVTYFTNGEKLAAVSRVIPATKGVASAAVAELLEAPTPAERSRGFDTEIPQGTELLGVAVTGRVATVDLSAPFASGGGTMSMGMRLAQVVCTLTQFPSIDAVTFKLEGEPVDVFGSEGIVLDTPQKREDYEDLLGPVLIDSPGYGATVSSPLRVKGSANVYEGNFHLALTDADGNTIATKQVQTSGSGTRGTFDVRLSWGPDEDPTQLNAYYFSPKDGKKVVVTRYRVRTP